MKKIIMLLVMMFCFSGFAQGGIPPGGMPSMSMKPSFDKKMSTDELLTKMIQKLKLDELQQLQVREILKDMENHEDFDPSKMKSGERPDFQAVKEKMESKKSELTTKLAKIFTAEQLKKWQEESDNWNAKER